MLQDLQHPPCDVMTGRLGLVPEGPWQMAESPVLYYLAICRCRNCSVRIIWLVCHPLQCRNPNVLPQSFCPPCPLTGL